VSSVIRHLVTTVSISRSSLNLLPPWRCFSAANRWQTLGDEFPWYNHNQCGFLGYRIIRSANSFYDANSHYVSNAYKCLCNPSGVRLDKFESSARNVSLQSNQTRTGQTNITDWYLSCPTADWCGEAIPSRLSSCLLAWVQIPKRHTPFQNSRFPRFCYHKTDRLLSLDQSIKIDEMPSTTKRKYKVVQIWPGQTVTCLHTNSPGHIWTTLYIEHTLSLLKKSFVGELAFEMCLGGEIVITCILKERYLKLWIEMRCLVIGSSGMVLWTRRWTFTTYTLTSPHHQKNEQSYNIKQFKNPLQ
jgi:hypothetical protein